MSRSDQASDLTKADQVCCEGCYRAVDEFIAIAERWGYWSDGCGELLPFCPECAKREFAPDARETPRARTDG